MEKFYRAVLVVILVIVPLGILPSNLVGAQEVIVNLSVDKKRINKHSLKSIFSMHLVTWSDGTPIKVFVLPGKSTTHVSFSKQVLNTLPHNLQRTWDRFVYSGTGQSPVIVMSESEMINKIATTKGAIGYVEDSKDEKGIKVLHVY